MYKKVLVPLDGSELAECAVNHVSNLIKEGSAAEAILFHVVKVDIPWVKSDGEENKKIQIDVEKIREKAFSSSRAYLAKVEARLPGLKVKSEALEANRPGHAIIEYAQKNGVDAIALATHGHTGMRDMLLGSVAHYVLHNSNVPVLLIRPDACKA